MVNTNGIIAALERKAEISTAQPERFTSLRQAAERLSLHNVDAAIVEVLNEALGRLLLLAYTTDTGGLCNVDAMTGRLLVPAPMGRNGQAKWGIRPSEANVLRQILFDWHDEERSCLFCYDRSRRAWYVDLANFPSAGLAKGWLRAHQISVGIYRAARAKVAQKR